MRDEKSKEKYFKINKSNKTILLLILIFAQIALVSCKQKGSEPLTKTAFALDTVIQITVYDYTDESVLEEAIELVDKYENMYSRTLENSELYQLNNRNLQSASENSNVYEISEELRDIIAYGLDCSANSKGAFDLTIEPLSSLWNFKAEEVKVPEKELISKAVNQVEYKNVVLNGNKIYLKDENTKLELGAIAKGYIADKVKGFLISQGVESAIIDLGGNILCVGNKPNGEPFKIGIQKPFADRNEIIAVMDIVDKSVVTSGVYERYFFYKDELYHHILNPQTGYPYDNNLISVTIVSQKSVEGDGLSTTCFALGLEEGLTLINSLANVHAIFVTEDYVFHYSEGFFEDINVIEVKEGEN